MTGFIWSLVAAAAWGTVWTLYFDRRLGADLERRAALASVRHTDRGGAM